MHRNNLSLLSGFCELLVEARTSLGDSSLQRSGQCLCKSTPTSQCRHRLPLLSTHTLFSCQGPTFRCGGFLTGEPRSKTYHTLFVDRRQELFSWTRTADRCGSVRARMSIPSSHTHRQYKLPFKMQPVTRRQHGRDVTYSFESISLGRDSSTREACLVEPMVNR